MWQATWEAKNDSQASARDWLDPYTIDFNSDFYRGKPLNADVIAAGIKADEARILGMGARLRVAADQGARRREGGEFRGPRAAGGAARGRGGDWRRLRLDPAQTPVLEALVNAVIDAAPGARVAFNTSPTDTAEAIGRVSNVES